MVDKNMEKSGEEARLKLVITAKELAKIKVEKEKIRLELVVTAKELANAAVEKEKTRLKLVEFAKHLEGVARERKDERLKLVITAKELAKIKVEKEKIRLELVITAKELAKIKVEKEKQVAEIKENEERFEDLFNNMDESVAIYEVRDGGKEIIIKDLNKAAEKLENVKKENVIGKKVDVVFKGVIEFGLYDLFKKVWKTGEPMQHPISFYKDKYHRGWRDNFVFKLPTGEVVAIYSDVTAQKKVEEELKQSEEKFRSLFENTNDSIFIYNIDGKILEVNNIACKNLSYTKKELLLLSPKKVDSPKFAKYVSARIKEVLLKGSSLFETVHIAKSGKEIPVEVNAKLIEFEGQRAIISICRDITERKKVEENIVKQVGERTVELNKQRAFLSSVLENVPDMIFVKDAKDLKFELFNKAGEELLGYKKADLIGKSDYDFFPKDQAEFFIKKDREVLKHKEVLDIPEEPIETKYGKRYLHTKKIPIFEDHRAMYLMGISEDITERRKTEIEYKRLLESMSDGFYITDLKGNISEVNSAYCNLTGYKRLELLKMNIDQLDVVQSPEKILAKILEIKEVGFGRFETKNKCKDGKLIEVEVSVNYYELGQKFFFFVRDITVRKEIENEVKQRSEELERFNRAAVGRELKMVELKKKIAKLEDKRK